MKHRSTNPSHYYARQVAETPLMIYRRPTVLERYGELIALSLGLVVFGMALGMLVFGLVFA